LQSKLSKYFETYRQKPMYVKLDLSVIIISSENLY
jgi:hypothetical protein